MLLLANTSFNSKLLFIARQEQFYTKIGILSGNKQRVISLEPCIKKKLIWVYKREINNLYNDNKHTCIY